MLDLLAPDATSEGSDGKAAPVERERVVAMRGFERAVRTQWSFTLRKRGDLDVSASLREANDFYDALGVGACHQTVVYSVRDGKIARLATKEISYTGRAYRQAFAEFETWL